MMSKTVMQWLRKAAALGLMGTALVLAGCGGGGSSTASNPSTPAPSLSTISPTFGSSSGGTSITLTGTNLSNAQSVTVGSSAASIISDTATTIVASTPSGTPGSIVNVTVTTAGGSSTLSNAFTYSEASITSMSPSNGSSSGGTTVVLVGSHLANASSVTFGSNLATILSNTDSEIQVTAPPGTPCQSVTVTVTTPDGPATAPTSFEYYTTGVGTLSASPSSLSFIATDNRTVTFTNTGTADICNLSSSLSGGLSSGVNADGDCNNLSPDQTCIYTFYSASQHSGDFTLSGTYYDADGNPQSATTSVSVDITPVTGTVVELPSADISDGESAFLQNAYTHSLNTVFVDIGSLDFSYPLGFGSASGNCNLTAFFDYYAPAALGSECVNFSDLVNDYRTTSDNSNLNVAVWISSTTEPIPNAEATAVAGVIGDEITTTGNQASGVAIEGSALFSDPDPTALGNFYTTLASTLKAADKTLYIYEAPWNDLTPATLSTLKADGNVVALVPLYDIAASSDNGQTATYTGAGNYPAQVTATVSTPLNSGNQYGDLPFMYMPPASGTYGNWQDLLLYQGETGQPYDPYYHSTIPSDVTTEECTTVDGSAPSPCGAYHNGMSVVPPVPGGYTPDNPQMFAYTQSALCAISNNTSVMANASGYGGVIYYNVRPAAFWSSKNDQRLNAQYPVSIESASWQMLQAWSNSETRAPICQCTGEGAGDSAGC